MDFFNSLKKYDLWDFKKYVFSIGTYEGDSYRQACFPIKNYKDTLIFAIDEKYTEMDTSESSIFINNYKLIQQKNKFMYYNEENNFMIIFNPNNIHSEYYQKGDLPVYSNFIWTLTCKPKSNKWESFEYVLFLLLKGNKRIYINNWAFFNSRYFEEVGGKIISRNRDIGHYFEYFPEIGYILKKLYNENKDIKLYISTYQNSEIVMKQIQEIDDFN